MDVSALKALDCLSPAGTVRFLFIRLPIKSIDAARRLENFSNPQRQARTQWIAQL